jgi:hypothetical protein
MAIPATPNPSLTRTALDNVCWSFVGDTFADRPRFSDEVRQYQIDITGKDSWQPNAIAIPAGLVRVVYSQGGLGDDGQVELSSEQQFFTAGELLFQLHNAVVQQLRDVDQHFFEGLELVSGPSPSAPAIYRLRLGS